MSTSDYSITITVDQTPAEAFKAITNVRGWWSEEIEGGTEKLNDVFLYHYEDVHQAQIKLIEVVSNKKIVWLIEKNFFKFTKDTTEWTGNTISFDIFKKDDKTQIHFIHHGLAPAYECYAICTNAWSQYIQKSLHDLITTGKGQPNGKGKPTTADEARLGSTK